MKVSCHTNLDLVSEIWPTDLPAAPRVGDKIRSQYVWDNGFQLDLEVVSVTWVYVTKADLSQGYIPMIELHIPSHRAWTIRSFYEWYAPKIGRRVASFL